MMMFKHDCTWQCVRLRSCTGSDSSSCWKPLQQPCGQQLNAKSAGRCIVKNAKPASTGSTNQKWLLQHKTHWLHTLPTVCPPCLTVVHSPLLCAFSAQQQDAQWGRLSCYPLLGPLQVWRQLLKAPPELPWVAEWNPPMHRQLGPCLWQGHLNALLQLSQKVPGQLPLWMQQVLQSELICLHLVGARCW